MNSEIWFGLFNIFYVAPLVGCVLMAILHLLQKDLHKDRRGLRFWIYLSAAIMPIGNWYALIDTMLLTFNVKIKDGGIHQKIDNIMITYSVIPFLLYHSISSKISQIKHGETR